MPTSRLPILAVLLLLNSLGFAAETPWHHPLYLAGTGWWAKRVAVKAVNDGAGELAGFPVSIPVGSAAGQVPLLGQPAESVRVCDVGGTEMLFVLRDAGGAVVAQGPISEGSTLAIPVECAAHATALYYIYFDNPQAGRLPDFLSARTELANGDLELGDGDTPVAWRHDPADQQHRASWSSEQPHSGRRCLKTVVADGAEPTWISTRQGDMAVVGGAKYRLQAWVRADNVRGFCGWYVHVGNQQQPMQISPMLTAGEGTFAWKQVVAEFTAPADADRLSLGTVLRGTGTAWFDSATLQCLSPGAVRAEVGPVETLAIREIGTDARALWPVFDRATAPTSGLQSPAADLKPSASPGAGQPRPTQETAGTRPSDAAGPPLAYRAAVRALNLSGEARPRTTVAVELGRLQARLRGRLNLDSLVVTLNGQVVPHRRVLDQLLIAAPLPARSAATFYLYFAAGAAAAASQPDAAALVDSNWNLVRNPSFEQGEPLPDSWIASGMSQPQGIAFSLDSSQRGAVGSRCARLHVPSDAPKAWRGWRQDVPVQPGRTYLLSARVKCQDVGGEVRVHAHRLNAAGQLCRQGAFASVGPSLAGTTDWTLLSGTLSMPDDAATLQVHLTMENTGTVWHDGVTVLEVVPGQFLGLETQHAAPDDRLAVWQVPAVIKVFQDDLPLTGKPGPAAKPPNSPEDSRLADGVSRVPAVEICAARNEQEPLQLALRSPCELRGVKIHVDPPVGPQGFSLDKIRTEVVGYVPIDYPSNYYQTKVPAWQRKVPSGAGRGDGWSGLWPDPLLPRSGMDLPANATQPVWITVSVPKDAPAGDYQGRVRLEASGRALASVPFRVHVWDFALPDENHVAAIYDARFGPDAGAWGRSLDAMYPELIRLMASRRLCPDMIRPSPKFRRENGKLTADFTDFDRAAQVYFEELKLPFSYTPEDLYLFGWGHPPKPVFGEQPYPGRPPFESADRSRLRPEYKQVYQEMLRLYWEHVKQRGWQRRIVLYISDEPYDQHEHIRRQMQALCEMIHEVDPAIPIYSSTWKHVPDWDGSLNIWGLGHYGPVPSEKMAQLRSRGDRVWFTTDGQMCTDTPYCAVERLLPHYCFQYGAQAYEFWGVAWHTYDPYRFGWHSFISQSGVPGETEWVRYPNGDGFLLYPGQPVGHDGPVSSIRLEQAREGVEDYEYLFLLQGRIAAAKSAGRRTDAAEQTLRDAQTLVRIPNDGGYYSTHILPDPERLYATRRALAAAIEGLGK